MRVRIALGVSILSILLLVIASPALGCNPSTPPPPTGTGPGGGAGPNSPVSFSVGGVDPGADVKVTLDPGGVVYDKANGNAYPGVSDTFNMPDLGNAPIDVEVTILIWHDEDQTYIPFHSTIAYQPASAPVAPPSQSVSKAPLTAPTNAVHKSAPHHPVATHSPPPPQPGVGSSVANARTPRTEVRSSDSESGQSQANAVVKDRSSEQTPGVSHGALHALTSTTRVGPADVPTIGLLLIAVIVIAGAALAAFVIYLLRRGPDPEAAIKAPAPIDPDPIEAELQEMIADEMARQLLSDLDLGEPTLTR